MRSAAKSVLGVILASLAASPFTEPLNWWIGNYLDAHPGAFPGAVARAWGVVVTAAEFIPGGLFLGIAAGATVAFVLMRGWRVGPAPAAVGATTPDAPGSAAAAAAAPATPPRADPFARTYKDQAVRLPDLIVDAHYILRGKQFENCVIHGPAVIHLFEGIVLLDCSWNCGNDVEEMFIRIKGASMHNGLIGLAECTFLHCSFRGISIIGTDAYCDLYKKELFGL